MSNERLIDRRSVCQEHTATMKEIFEQVDKRLPIWAFLAAISIIGAAFGFVTYLSNDSMAGVHARITSHITSADKNMLEIKSTIKEINYTLTRMQVNQAVNTTNIQEMAKDMEAIKRDGHERNKHEDR